MDELHVFSLLFLFLSHAKLLPRLFQKHIRVTANQLSVYLSTFVAMEQFHHPYTPYDIQLQFMQALYACLEDGKVGVFESPTGKHPWIFGPVVMAAI